MLYPQLMLNAKRWMVRRVLPNSSNKRPYSALSSKPKDYIPKSEDEYDTAWRWRWNRPEIWATYEQAEKQLRENREVTEGLSFVLHPGGDESKKPRIICLDFDHSFDEDGKPWPWVQKILGEADSYVEVSRSGKGLHLFVEVECEPFTNMPQQKHDAGGAIEVLCSSQVAVTGKPFGDLKQIKTLPFEFIESLPHFEHRKAQQCEANCDFTEWWEAEDTGIRDELMWLADEMCEWSEAIKNHGRSKTTFSAACRIMRWGVTGWEAYHLLGLVPTTPPLTDAELKHKLEDAYAKTIDDGTFDKGTPEFQEIEEATESEHQQSTKKSDGDWFKVYSLNDLKQHSPQRDAEVIVDMLQVKDVANIIASSKLGKSYFIGQLLVSFVADVPWLGYKFGQAKRKVLLLDNELKPFQIWKRLERISDALGVEFASVQKSIDVASLRGKRKTLQEIEPYLKKIAPNSYGMIVLDSNYRAHGNESDPEIMGKFYDTMTAIADHAQAAMIGVHHSTKGSQSEKDVMDMGSGSGVIGRAVDAHMTLRKHEMDDCVVLEAGLRNYKSPAGVVLRREFPLWVIEDTLDPRRLLKPNQKRRFSQEEVLEVLTDMTIERETSEVPRPDLVEELVERGCAVKVAQKLVFELSKTERVRCINTGNRTYSLATLEDHTPAF